MPLPVYGVFAGGGVAGIAHAGAIAAARSEPYSIRFFAVAGTSAGAIAAALVAAGFDDNEIKAAFEELTAPAATGTLLTETLPGYNWQRYRKVADFLEYAFASQTKRQFAFRFLKNPVNVLRLGRVLVYAWRRRGIFRVDGMVQWLECQLRKKITSEQPMVMFRDLTTPLKVIAAQLEPPQVTVFSRETTPHVPVARAVGASIAVPILFQPVSLTVDNQDGAQREREYIDGGLLSVFPAWAFASEVRESGLSIPILGFRLILAPKKDDPTNLWSHLKAVCRTMIRGSEDIQARDVAQLWPVPLDASGTEAMRLDLTRAKGDELYRSGFDGMRTKLDERIPGQAARARLHDRVRALLAQLCDDIRMVLEREQGQIPAQWLRANVFLVSDVGKAAIQSLSYNMDAHPDKSFEFPLFGGSTGTAFARRTQVIAPLYLETQDEYRALEAQYQQALLDLNVMNLPEHIQRDAWDRLKTILSTPIRDHPDPTKVVGVLNVDTCCTLSELPLHREPVTACADQYARLIAHALSEAGSPLVKL